MTPDSARRSARRRGTVYLVGAGPGDPDLLTVRAARLLRRADVVVHDALVSQGILDRVRPDAELIDVGKRCGGRRTSQERIHEILLDAAARSKTVVRLKGGDPFLFGRGGEEALALSEHGIRFRIVPGVTAGIGASAYAGIPVTHRDLASSVTFVTGHEDPRRPNSRVDWEALAKVEGTLAIYMGVGKLAEIVQRLITGGRAAATPAAVIEWGTLASQRTVTASLSGIADTAREAGIRAPALVVIGDVVDLRKDLSWFDVLPLSGRRAVVARSRPQPSRISSALRRLGADVVDYPTLTDEPETLSGDLASRIKRLPDYDWLLFSSPSGVEHFWRLLHESGLDTRALGNARVASLGAATTVELERRGVRPDTATRTFEVQTVAGLLGSILPLEGSRILFPRESNVASAVGTELRDRGAYVDDFGAFRTVADRASLNAAADADFIILPSSTAASTLASSLGNARPKARVVAIGPATARVAEASGLPVDAIAEEHTVQGILKAVRRLAGEDDALGRSRSAELPVASFG